MNDRATLQSPKLLDQLRAALRVKHYAYRTEKSYVYWVRRCTSVVCPHPLSRRLLPRFWAKIAGLSATNIVRLKRFWEDEFLQWEKRDLKAKE